MGKSLPPMMSIEELRKKRAEENDPEVSRRSTSFRTMVKRDAERREKRREEDRTAIQEKKCKVALLGTAGLYKDALFPLDDEIFIGREIGLVNIVYPEDKAYISKVHCKVWVDESGRVLIQDQGSTNGTYFDDEADMQPGKTYPIDIDSEFYLSNHDESFKVVRV